MSLTHFDAQGQAHMVDVGPKTTTHRIAVATGDIHMLPATLALIESGNAKKGDVIGIARIAGIQAAKKTSDLIPLPSPMLGKRPALFCACKPTGATPMAKAMASSSGRKRGKDFMGSGCSENV